MVYKVGSVTELNSVGTEYFMGSALIPSGGYVNLCLTVENGDSDYDDLYLQRFDASGALVGSAQQIVPQEGLTWDPDSAFNTDGSYVVTWGYSTQDGIDLNYDVYFQRYTALGEAVGSATKVTTTTADSQTLSHVAYLANGGFVIAWDSYDVSESEIMFARYNANGVKLGNETVVNSYTSGHQWSPDLAVLSSGGRYAVSWIGNGADEPDDKNFYMKIFKADGTSVTADTRINNSLVGTVREGMVEQLKDSTKFVAGWVTEGTGSYTIDFEIINSTGKTLSTAATISKEVAGEGHYFGLSVTSLSDGGFLASWVKDNDGAYSLMAQRFNADARALGDVFSVYTAVSSLENIYGPQALELSDGNLVLSWGRDLPWRRYQVLMTYENSKPTVVDDTGSMREDSPTTFNVLANDKDADGDLLSIKDVVVSKGKATVDVGKDGTLSVTYTGPNMGPTDTADLIIKYAVSDGQSKVKSALNLTVQGVIEDINGTERSETLKGTELGETIRGQDGYDTIFGNGGDDIIMGGKGRDVITGGAGSDQHVFWSFEGAGVTSLDRIKDFDAVGSDHDYLTFFGFGYDSRDDLKFGYSKDEKCVYVLYGGNDLIYLEGITKTAMITSDMLHLT